MSSALFGDLRFIKCCNTWAGCSVHVFLIYKIEQHMRHHFDFSLIQLGKSGDMHTFLLPKGSEVRLASCTNFFSHGAGSV